MLLYNMGQDFLTFTCMSLKIGQNFFDIEYGERKELLKYEQLKEREVVVKRHVVW